MDFSDQEPIDDNMSPLPHVVFISHTSINHDLIKREIVPLLRELQFDVHLVNRSSPSLMISNRYYRRIITRNIYRCWWFIVILSSASVLSKWVKYEVDQAFKGKAKKQIVPIIIEECDLSLLDSRLRKIDAVDFRRDISEVKHDLADIMSKTGGW